MLAYMFTTAANSLLCIFNVFFVRILSDFSLKWAPFNFPALGFFALFACKEIDTSIGNLSYSYSTDFLPVLGSYTVAKDDFAASQPGFVLYNLTDGIMTTDVSAWFTRWLMSSPLTPTSTIIRLRRDGQSWPWYLRLRSLPIAWNILTLVMLLALNTNDSWGMANVAVMATAVLVRHLMINQRRSFIDRAIEESHDEPNSDVKVFLTLPNGKAVTILAPRNLMVNCILTDSRQTVPCYYYLLRIICWVLLAAQFVTLSMSSLPVQIMSICVLLLGTYLTAIHFGTEPEYIGSRLRLETDHGDESWSRSHAYARLEMTKDEEDAMVNWSLLPQRSNKFWWDKYEKNHLAPRREAKDLGVTPYSL